MSLVSACLSLSIYGVCDDVLRALCVCVHACMHIRKLNTSIQVCYNNMYVNINKNVQSGNTDNNKQSLSVHILLSLLHACARASCALVQFLSNSSGQSQKRVQQVQLHQW